MGESWLPIPGWEGLYSVSSDGRVKSHSREVPQLRWGRSDTRRIRERILKQSDNGEGYLTVVLCRKGSRLRCKVHRLVLEVFSSDTWYEGAVACHNDGNSHNNALANLRWDTQKANVQDAIRHGTRHPKKRAP